MTTKTTARAKTVKLSTKPQAVAMKKHSMDVIIRPRITEKATLSAEKNQYVFEITAKATKPSIAAAIKDMYKVTPLAVNITHTPAKKVRVKGREGVQSAVRKAYVTLKKGDKIDLA